MVEWVDYEHINERHRYQQINDEPFCWICKKSMDDHWFPNDPTKLVELHNEVDDIARQAWDET